MCVVQAHVLSTAVISPVRIRPGSDIREAAEAAFAEHRKRLTDLVPGAVIEHVGSTAVPGALTKGDLDVLVRVDADRFDAAVGKLRGAHTIHQPHNWTPTLASFVDRAAADPPVGIQLVVAGSPDDLLFGPFRDTLISDRALLEQYNALKRFHDGSDYQTYTDVKSEFVLRVLAGLERDRDERDRASR